MTANSLNGGNERHCVVLGVNGQDGSYLAEHLLSRGYRVTGVGRQRQSKWVAPHAGFTYTALDLGNVHGLSAFLQEAQPNIVFHLAAVTGSAEFVYEDHWVEAHQVNTMSAHAVLEYLRRHRNDGVLVYVSTSKVFGPALPETVNEDSPRSSSCIYTVTKNAATELIQYYRARHAIKAGVVWTFNHESPRRSEEFFIARVVAVLARAIMGERVHEQVLNLRFWCDWGDASEYMDLLCDIAERASGKDLVLATGAAIWAQDLVREMFTRHGLTAEDYLSERLPSQMARGEGPRVDLSGLQAAIGRVPRRNIRQVCDEILRQNYPEAWAAAGNKK